METLASPKGRLLETLAPSPSPSSSRSGTNRLDFRRYSRQPTIPRMHLRKSFLFAQHPDVGPAMNVPSPASVDGTKRCELIHDPTQFLEKHDENFYGRFITLGYHCSSGPMHDPLRTKSERNKTFELWKRVEGNGWRFTVDSSGGTATTILDTATRERLRNMSLNMSSQERSGSSSIRVTSVHPLDQIVQYTLLPSPDHDLFQFGRDPYNNDFHIPGHQIEGHTWDPVSRLAFRVQCSRNDRTDIKIAAAGFDCANELFLGPYALRWGTQPEGGPKGGMDGGITVGLYIWKPNKHTDGINGGAAGEGPANGVAAGGDGEWYEVSALGEVYHLRAAGRRGRKAVGVDNVLTDGCIIVNANSVLLFTTSPPSKDNEYLTPETLSSRLEQIKNTLCPITYDHIPLRNAMLSNALPARTYDVPPPNMQHAEDIPSHETHENETQHNPDNGIQHNTNKQNGANSLGKDTRRPGIFPGCGHVFEMLPATIAARLPSCPTCRTAGHMVPLLLQTAPTFMRADEEHTHILPCGHAVSESLGKRMAGVGIPSNDLLLVDIEAKTWGMSLVGRRRRCWFCGAGFNPSDLKRIYFERD